MQPLCPICNKIYKNPVECNTCRTNICEEHIKEFDYCPKCKAFPYKYSKNQGLIKLLEKQENERINKMIQIDKNIYQCKFCFFESTPDYLCFHLAQEHKKALIENFGRKKEKNNEKRKDKIEIINNKIYPNSVFKKEENPLLKPISGEIKFDNYCISERLSQNNEIKKKHKFSKSANINKVNNKDLYYCGNKNEMINCNCCLPDNKCIKGNCLCINCMKYNIKKLNLHKGELINKAGRIAIPEKGEFHCQQKFQIYVNNEVGLKIPAQKICSYKTNFTCKECVILNKYKDIYNDFIYKM